MNKVSTYPRNQRYVFGKSMEDKSLSVLDKLIRAYYQKDKVEILKEINVELEIIRYYLRLSKDMGFLTIKQFEFSINYLHEIGSQVGGWTKKLSYS